MPDYEDLAFKPELTWKELCEWIKENYDNAVIMKTPERINLNYVQFCKSGEVVHQFLIMAKNRTYEQMKTIIQALYEE
jgi:GTP cyclohydrolase I